MLGWELPPHNSGGLGVACLYLSRALAKHGAVLDFLVPYAADHHDINYMNILSASALPSAEFLPLGSYTHYFPVPAKNQSQPTGSGNESSPSIRSLQATYCQFLREYLADPAHRPDLIHAHDWLTFEAALIAKREYSLPFIAHVHATEYDRSGMQRGNPLIHDIEAEGLTAADQIIAVSENTKRIIIQKYSIPARKISVIYNSLGDNFLSGRYSYDSSHYQYLETLKSAGYTIVSTVGRFTLQKGLINLMHAAARAVKAHPQLMFVFAGDGEQKAELIELAATLGIAKNVLFTGFVRGRRLRDIYSVSDIFIMSSISEPFGLTALEAAHHGNALIITKQSGVAEILYSIMTYDFWDEVKLANEIVAIARSAGLREALQANIQQEYQRISWDDIAGKCLSLYHQVQKEHK